MSLLKTALESGQFAITAEMAPPKGFDFSEPLATANLLRGKVHGINVTYTGLSCGFTLTLWIPGYTNGPGLLAGVYVFTEIVLFTGT